ncbi:hypothetical protein RJ641_012652 [Dillenia turbinata]|uniref:Uncharacterized protein n=1 Tax=Dillenia turbinata TaxID=194707 RepID=A0AAN8UUM2_9MAGN
MFGTLDLYNYALHDSGCEHLSMNSNLLVEYSTFYNDRISNLPRRVQFCLKEMQLKYHELARQSPDSPNLVRWNMMNKIKCHAQAEKRTVCPSWPVEYDEQGLKNSFVSVVPYDIIMNIKCNSW